MSSGNGSGLSRARVRSILRSYVAPGPIPQTEASLANGNRTITVTGLNIQADTRVVLVPTSTTGTATFVPNGAQVATPSGKDVLGTVAAPFTFATVPSGAVPNLYQIYLTGALGQRVYVGTVNGAA